MSFSVRVLVSQTPTFLVVADRRRDLYEIGRVQKLSAVITSLNGSGEFFGF